jgi:hypothetical protein
MLRQAILAFDQLKNRYYPRSLVVGGFDMKKFIAIAGLSMALAGPASAATFASRAVFEVDRWNLSWPVQHADCGAVNPLPLSSFAFVVDGESYAPTSISVDVGDPDLTVMAFTGVPNGNILFVTNYGNKHLVCGPHTYLLPDNVATAPAIPTLSEWAMILLGLLLAGGAAFTLSQQSKGLARSGC